MANVAMRNPENWILIDKRPQRYVPGFLENVVRRSYGPGRHKNPETRALLEPIDNSLEKRDKGNPEQPTIINVSVDHGTLRFTDIGGMGGDGVAIQKALDAGKEKQGDGLGIAGLGMKAAIIILGRDVEITAKPVGEGPYFRAKIKDYVIHFETQQETELLSGPTPGRKIDNSLGFWELVITGVRDGVVKKAKDGDFEKVLSAEYRPVLIVRPEDALSGRTVYNDQGEPVTVYDHIRINFAWGAGKTYKIEPLKIPLDSRYVEAGYSDAHEHMAHVDMTLKINDRDGSSRTVRHHVWGWVGVIDPDHADAKGVEPGLRFYFDGKLIKVGRTQADMGFDLKADGLANLTGEFYLDNIKDLTNEFQLNKSMEIESSNYIWKQIRAQIAEVDHLKRLVARLQSESHGRPKIERTDSMRESADFARRVANIVLSNLINNGHLSEDALNYSREGIRTPRPPRPPEPVDETRPVRIRPEQDPDQKDQPPIKDTQRKPNKEKKKSFIGDIRWEPLDDKRPYAYRDDPTAGRILVINTDHPRYVLLLKNDENKRDQIIFLTDVIAELAAERAATDENGVVNYERSKAFKDKYIYDAYEAMASLPEWLKIDADASAKDAALRMAKRAGNN